MKTNQNSNRNRTSNQSNRRPLNRNKQQNQRSTGLSGVRSRIGKPKVDLRQILTKKVKQPIKSTTKVSNVSSGSDVKSRLGLQSGTARLEAKKVAIAQLKSTKTKVSTM